MSINLRLITQMFWKSQFLSFLMVDVVASSFISYHSPRLSCTYSNWSPGQMLNGQLLHGQMSKWQLSPDLYFVSWVCLPISRPLENSLLFLLLSMVLSLLLFLFCCCCCCYCCYYCYSNLIVIRFWLKFDNLPKDFKVLVKEQ